MRAYIAGPMTGLPNLNFPAFHREAQKWRDLGHEVVNPAELNPDHTMPWAECMRRDIAALVTCDTIVLLPGYKQSKGASLELTIAKNLGLEVVNGDGDEGGLYAIVGPKGKMYIGQTQGFARRWVEHKSALRGNRHHCISLQRSWNKYGESAFRFQPMFVLPESCRNKIEQNWFDSLGRNLYNSALDVMAPSRGRKASEETKRKMSESHSGARNPNFGKPMPEETRRKISASRSGRFAGENSPFFGKPKSDAHRARLSASLTGKLVGKLNPGAQPVVCIDTGQSFPTYTAAAEWLRSIGHAKAELSAVRKAAIGQQKLAYGHRWKTLEQHIAERLSMVQIEATP